MLLERKDPGSAHVLLGDTPGHLLFLTEVIQANVSIVDQATDKHPLSL